MRGRRQRVLTRPAEARLSLSSKRLLTYKSVFLWHETEAVGLRVRIDRLAAEGHLRSAVRK